LLTVGAYRFLFRHERCDVAKKTAISRKNAFNKPAPKKKSTMKISGRMSADAMAPSKAASRKSAKLRPPKGPIWQWSALETAATIRSGAISSVEVIGAHIERMRAINPKLNAVVVDLSEEALKAAKAADKARARGAELGLLHGVPITIKENVDNDGRPNPNGVPSQMSIIAPSDAPVVRNLKKAGAIVIGLTNTPEFSFRGSATSTDIPSNRRARPSNDTGQGDIPISSRYKTHLS
jgi:amidase